MRVPPIVIAALVAATTSVALAAPIGREVVVHLTGTGFSPAASTIAYGDRVRFTVRDHKPHQIAKASGPDSGELAPNVLEGKGSSITLMQNGIGSYTYVDRLNSKSAQFRLTVRPH
jgi:plastocyanin